MSLTHRGIPVAHLKSPIFGLSEHLTEKNVFFRELPKLPLPPIRASCTTFLDVKKQRFSTYYKTNDYDNDGSDNCDYNFGTFDNFGVKNDQKVSHKMILMSKYKGPHGGKKGKKN